MKFIFKIYIIIKYIDLSLYTQNIFSKNRYCILYCIIILNNYSLFQVYHKKRATEEVLKFQSFVKCMF